MQRFNALKILAAACLIVGDKGGTNHSLTDKYWPTNKVSIRDCALLLCSEARNRAESQILKESSNHQIVASISLMNRHHGWGL